MATASSSSEVPNGDNDISTSKVPESTSLYVNVENTKWPIVYASEYNIGFCKLEKLHPFDAGKWGRVFEFLKGDGMIIDKTVVKPVEATEQDLLMVHTQKYLNSLKWSVNVARITEVPPVAFLPNFIVQRKVLKPFRHQTGGTILAAKLAVERGWGINIGGGFHHCSSESGGGFCAYADITLAIQFAFQKLDGINKAMIIDLDAHQGNGHERDFMDNDKVYILDVYNRGIYPHDGFAKRGIKRKVELYHYTEDEEYLSLVETNVEGALNEFSPDLIVYNAGTDILVGDPLGCLSITAKGIIQRDQIVFDKARSRNIPIIMVTSGGYMKETARIIADSILNLKEKELIGCEAAEEAQKSPPKVSKMKKSQSEGNGFFGSFFKKMTMSRSSSENFQDLNDETSDNSVTSKKYSECKDVSTGGDKYVSNKEEHCVTGTSVDPEIQVKKDSQQKTQSVEEDSTNDKLH